MHKTENLKCTETDKIRLDDCWNIISKVINLKLKNLSQLLLTYIRFTHGTLCLNLDYVLR